MRPVHVERALKAASAVYRDIATFFTTRMMGSDTTINRQRQEESSSALLDFVRKDPFGARLSAYGGALPPATRKTNRWSAEGGSTTEKRAMRVIDYLIRRVDPGRE
jgi:hypothetical protein